jgi:hypothetical protein
VDFAYRGHEILSVSVLNYKHHFGTDGHQIHPVSVTLDLEKSYKAIKASRIKQVEDPSLAPKSSPASVEQASLTKPLTQEASGTATEIQVIKVEAPNKPADLKLLGLAERDLGAN